MQRYWVRIALGAQRSDVVRLIGTTTLKLFAAGVAVGLLGSFGVMRVMASQILGVSPRDPVTLLLVVAVMALASIVACAVPMRRALRIHPVVALRQD